MSILNQLLVPESDTLLQQLLLWLRHQLLQLPDFANVTVSSNDSSTVVTGVIELATNQVRQDSGYFAAFCTVQLLAILAPALLAARVCRSHWRRRHHRHLEQRSRQAKASADEMSVYAVNGFPEVGAVESSTYVDENSVSTCATEADSEYQRTGTTMSLPDAHKSVVNARQHRCLVISMLMLLFLLLGMAIVSVALLVNFWSIGNQLQAQMLTTDNQSATFRTSTVDLVGSVNSLIDDLIKSSNATLIEEFQTNFHVIQSFFNRFARYIIDQLFELLKLQPVLVQLEAFISKIEAVVKIQSQANELYVELNSLASQVENLRKQLSDSCSKLCAATNYAECPSIFTSLNNLKLQVSSEELQFDSLTTVITFMRLKGINQTQMRKDFTGTYSSINQSLSTIDAEVQKLLSSVTTGIASEFNMIKNSSISLTTGFSQAAESDSVWAVVGEVRTYFILAVVIVSVVLLPFYVFAVLLGTELFRCLSWLLSSMAMECREEKLRHQRLTDLGSLGARPDRIGDLPVDGVSAIDLRRADERQAKLRVYRQRCLCSFRQLSGSARTYACGVLAVSLVTTLAFSLPVCVYYATSVADVRLCRYMRTPEGRERLDANLDATLLRYIWPSVTKLIEKSIQLPIPFDFSNRPDQLFTRLNTQCRNSSVSLFTALKMMNVINLTAFVYSPTVQQNLDYGKNMLHTALSGLAPETVLSVDLRSIGSNPEVSALGGLIDEELSKPNLLGQLDRPLLAISLGALNSSIYRLALSPAASADIAQVVIAKHLANQLAGFESSMIAPLQQRMSHLSSIINASAGSASAQKTIELLAKNIAGYKEAFSNPNSVKAAADRVYDATVVNYLPPLVELLDPMRVKILERLLPCLGFLRVYESGTELACSGVIESGLSVSLALMLSLIALLLSVCIFMGLLLQASGFCSVLRGCPCSCRDCDR